MGTDTDHAGASELTERYDRRVDTWKDERTTTIVLEELADGSWHATQRGVDVHGRGDSAAIAAAAYCRRVDGS